MLTGTKLSYSRNHVPVFSDLSFNLNEGELLIVKGENGTGKTTFLRLLAGLMRPLSGTLLWKGTLLNSHTLRSYQQNLLYVGHKLCLHPLAHVNDQICLWQDLYKVSKPLIEQALHSWGINPLKNKKIIELSHGQQKRLSLSRCAWLTRPLWILDEPLAGLDETGKKILSSFLSHHLAHSGSIVLATHESIGSMGSSSSLELTL